MPRLPQTWLEERVSPRIDRAWKTAWLTGVGRVLAGLGWMLGAWMANPRLEAADGSSGVHPMPAESWWAVQALPEGDGKSPGVDAWIEARLERLGVAPAPRAERRQLLRRLYLDLIGLPPTHAEVRAFELDSAPDAYLKRVNALLESPRYGERWARHWMDAVHFAETHGHDQDRIREHAWRYRDYLIQSFNEDKPYARLVREQIAGDVLYPDDPAAVVAMGFLSAGPWDESSLRDIREETLDRQIGRYLDRDDMLTTVMQTFASVTVQCARCHDHKFDPISQQDYYALQAVFAGVERANRPLDLDGEVYRRRRELKGLRAAAERKDAGVLLTASTKEALRGWANLQRTHAVRWTRWVPETFVSSSGAELVLESDSTVFVRGKHGPTDDYQLTFLPGAGRVSALQLEVLADDRLPQRGPGREANGNMHLSEVRVLCFRAGAASAEVCEVLEASSDFDQDGWDVARAVDGQDKTAWGIHPRVGQDHRAVFALKTPVVLGKGDRFTVVLRQLHGGHCVGRFRLSATDAMPGEVRVVPSGLDFVLNPSEGGWTEEQWLGLARWWVLREVDARLRALPEPSLVYVAAHDFIPDGGLKPVGRPRMVHVLHRGEILKPREEARPGTLAAVKALPSRFELSNPEDEGSRRAALAEWLSSRDNPLVWRSIVNRVWHHHFGRGLVETVNDFGAMGAKPSHPELLDRLAVWFRDEAKGSLKALHRVMVLTEAYQRSTVHPSERVRKPDFPDPENRLLWVRGRGRLDAEQVRDSILQLSGRLDLRMGGPSDRWFDLKPGIHVTPKVDYHLFDVDSDLGRRRGVYRFLFRTLPDPWMEALDCPAGDQLTPVRTVGVTVQQALALWNDAFVLRQAEHAGKRFEAGHRGDVEGQVRASYREVLLREPRGVELEDGAGYVRRHGLAAWIRVLWNSSEFLFVD